MAPPLTAAVMIPPLVRIPGTLAQAAAPMIPAKAAPRKAANAKCRIAPTATCPAETGMAFITAARAAGLIADSKLAIVELVALPLISRPIWLTVAAGTCTPISASPPRSPASSAGPNKRRATTPASPWEPSRFVCVVACMAHISSLACVAPAAVESGRPKSSHTDRAAGEAISGSGHHREAPVCLPAGRPGLSAVLIASPAPASRGRYVRWMTVFAGLASGGTARPRGGLLPPADTRGGGLACLGGAGGVDAGRQPDAERGGGQKLRPFRDEARLVLARHGVGEGGREAVPEGLGPVAQAGAAALVLGDRVDHQAALPGLPAGAEERGEAGEEALDVARVGLRPFHRGQPGRDEAAEIPVQGPFEDRLLGAEGTVEAGAAQAGGLLKVGDRRVLVALGPEHFRSCFDGVLHAEAAGPCHLPSP